MQVKVSKINCMCVILMVSEERLIFIYFFKFLYVNMRLIIAETILNKLQFSTVMPTNLFVVVIFNNFKFVRCILN